MNRLREGNLLLGMSQRCLLIVIFLLFSGSSVYAQQNIKGKIYSATTDSVIIAAAIYNKSLKVTAYSGRNGDYTIPAVEGDTLIFSAVGYMPDTVTVQFHMLLVQYDVTMQMRIITLETVKVTSSYYDDSLYRRDYYKNIFKKQPGMTGFNTPASGVGVVLSPLSYFSKAAKRKRTLKKRLLQEEKDSYIDRSFPVEWVSRLTGLKGDSLTLFMYRYRPSYEFCRKTDQRGMLIYINDKSKEFKHPESKN